MMMSTLHILVLAVIAFAVTFVTMPLVKKLAWRIGAVDYPSARRVNTVPTPRFGGVAVAFGVFVALLVQIIGEAAFQWSGFLIPDPPNPFVVSKLRSLPVNYSGVMFGLFVVTVVGAIDDIKGLKPGVKMLGQIVAALIIALSGVLLASISHPLNNSIIHFGIWAYPITVFWLVAFMNVINLIDGLDGLAGGIVVIAALTMFAIAMVDGRVEVALLSLVLVGSVVAFMHYNFPPASIFMGDSGALFMGGMLGIISLLGFMRSPAVIVLAAPLTVAAIPIGDTLTAIIRRAVRHQPIQQADKSHLHHVLLREGFSTRNAVLVIHAWTVLLAVGAFAMSFTHGLTVLLIFVALIVASGLIMAKLHIFDLVLRHHYHGRESSSPLDIVHVRRSKRNRDETE